MNPERVRSLLGAVLAVVLVIGTPAVSFAVTEAAAASTAHDALEDRGWVWPVDGVQLLRPFAAPAHAYGPGHRGVDLAAGATLRSPADGLVAFAGQVAGRPVVTIDHGDGLVTTLEPATTVLSVGDPVARGAVVARLTDGGHEGPGTVHFGVRWNGEYINPLRLLGGVPRAVLKACC